MRDIKLWSQSDLWGLSRFQNTGECGKKDGMRGNCGRSWYEAAAENVFRGILHLREEA